VPALAHATRLGYERVAYLDSDAIVNDHTTSIDAFVARHAQRGAETQVCARCHVVTLHMRAPGPEDVHAVCCLARQVGLRYGPVAEVAAGGVVSLWKHPCAALPNLALVVHTRLSDSPCHDDP